MAYVVMAYTVMAYIVMASRDGSDEGKAPTCAQTWVQTWYRHGPYTGVQACARHVPVC